MQLISKATLLFAIFWMILSACSGEGERQAIDQSYLESEMYREFEQKSDRETSGRVDMAVAFERVLKNLFTDPRTPGMEVPATVDSTTLSSHIDSSFKIELKRSMLNEPVDMDYIYFPVGKAQYGGLGILYFLIQKKTTYKDQDLAVATFRDTSLLEVQSIGTFSRNLSRREHSVVKIDQAQTIISQINRTTTYPIPQESSTTFRYTIDENGSIREEVISGKN